jgi:hypothetical protein
VGLFRERGDLGRSAVADGRVDAALGRPRGGVVRTVVGFRFGFSLVF